MRVVAVSVGTPRWETVEGHPVFTSIVREPLDRPLHFDSAGPADNMTAVHTEQVLAFSAEHYDHWAAALGVERARWHWCHWGENLTVSGLDENRLRIGDVVCIGGTAKFQVTSPRIPCFKLAWRIGQPNTVLPRLIEDGRIGIYLRVLEPGWVAAGDPITVASPYPDSITLGDISRLLVDDTATDPNALRRVLATPGLGEQAIGMLINRINLLTDGARTRTDRWTGWRELEISEVAETAEQIVSFRLRPADGAPLAPYRAGQFLTVRLPESADGTIRTWSLSDYDEDDPTSYRLSIKATAPGASRWMHRNMTVGSRISARAPAGRFMLERASFYRVVLISAGIGVTPLLAMLKAHAARSDPPPLIWLHVTRSGATHAFGDEVARIIENQPTFTRIVRYTAPDARDRIGFDFDAVGRLTAPDLDRIVRASQRIQPFGRQIDLGGEFSEFYICGPKPFEDMVRETLLAASVPPPNIRSESFGAPIAPPRIGPAIEHARVRFSRSGIECAWQQSDGMTLLELAEAQGITPPWSCRAGDCQTCETGLLAGAVDYEVTTHTPPGAGRVLICCARPGSATVVLDL